MKNLNFIDEHGSFSVERPENVSYLYFPLASETGLKSSVTPNLGGDTKIDQETFLLEPVSAENLHANRSTRNFWLVDDNAGVLSATGVSAKQEDAKFTPLQDESVLTAGFMWQTVKRLSKLHGLESTITSFIPMNDNVEIMYVTVQNLSKVPLGLTAYAAIPIYGRSADNLRDHRNVTSMLHRIRTNKDGVFVHPSMSFDEKGHRPNNRIYYVMGCTGDGGSPTRFYPTVEEFVGEGGSFTRPRAVYEQRAGRPPFEDAAGKEAMGAFRFDHVLLAPDEKAEFILLAGVADKEEDIFKILQKFNSSEKARQAFHDTKAYWQNQVSICFHTKERDFDSFMKWICFQPFLRRLFGCSFLPHHDYGRGGRGWRDLWQDCLSLLLMDPQGVGQMIVENFKGVRIDGTNATIIGNGDGNFIADRNGIARVWMDHALWPQMTTKLYIDQTGDIDILNKRIPYFKDAQAARGTAIDASWKQASGNLQQTEKNEVYDGSILEHLLIQQLTAFYEVGEHNVYRLRGADWNDALDMAAERGESVAFTCAYTGNLLELASMIRLLDERSSIHEAELLEEIEILLDDDVETYHDIKRKQEILSNYTRKCLHAVSGRRKVFPLTRLAVNLIQKANWLIGHVRTQEWISDTAGGGWFNSYYDNHGRAVEGVFPDHVRMMLTGQVFAIMSGVAEYEHVKKIVKSADRHLYRKDIGGYRLNTDFHELKFDLGRMFGFAYGEKENGAVFSHMAVMYANALYRRGFVREGWKALKTLADAALDFDTSRIYPGIPEYFRSDGRGMYHYLTGAASWFLMTMITEVFGIRGVAGNLVVYPKLLAEQFDGEGTASITTHFANEKLVVTFYNKNRKDFGDYVIGSATHDGKPLSITEDSFITIPRETLATSFGRTHQIIIHLQ